MKIAQHLLFLASMVLGVGCATDPTPADPNADQTELTNQADQEIGGGSCPAHDNCYSLCRIRYKCTTTTTCNQLSHCLDQCDADYPTCV
jgi:hypothetical protein